MKPPSRLSETEVHERILNARDVLGTDTAETIRAQTALDAARKALWLLSFGLVAAMEADQEDEPVTRP